MDTFNAVGIAEGFIEAESQEQVVEAWQLLIDTGLVWKLQGWFGRTASQLIGQGICQEPDPRRIPDPVDQARALLQGHYQ
jgi:hypothetical protein